MTAKRSDRGVRLRRSHAEDRCYYVEVDGLRVGRVRFNDGWNAAMHYRGAYDSLAGTWRSRGAAVDGLLDEWRSGR